MDKIQKLTRALSLAATFANRTITEHHLNFYVRKIESLPIDEVLRVIELYAEDNRLPSVKEIREGCGHGRLSNQDKAVELVNCAVQGIAQFGLNAKLAKDKLPAIAFLAIGEWGGWYSWASLTDERLDHAKRGLKSIIERMLKTGEVNQVDVALMDSSTMDEVARKEAAKKRDAMYNDPNQIEEIKKTAEELAQKFGFKK